MEEQGERRGSTVTRGRKRWHKEEEEKVGEKGREATRGEEGGGGGIGDGSREGRGGKLKEKEVTKKVEKEEGKE